MKLRGRLALLREREGRVEVLLRQSPGLLRGAALHRLPSAPIEADGRALSELATDLARELVAPALPFSSPAAAFLVEEEGGVEVVLATYVASAALLVRGLEWTDLGPFLSHVRAKTRGRFHAFNGGLPADPSPSLDWKEAIGHFGERLRTIRLLLGLSQQEAAARLDLDTGFLSQIERAVKFPSLRVVHLLASLVQVHPAFLLYGLQPGGAGRCQHGLLCSLLSALPREVLQKISELVGVLVSRA